MEKRKAKYPITPQMHALRRAQELSRLRVEREEKRKEIRKRTERATAEAILERYTVPKDDPRFPIAYKAVVAAGLAGMDVSDPKVSGQVAAKALESHERTFTREETDVIYYVQVGDLIKLGTTRNLTRRLRAYPPNAVVLATEPGSYLRETERVEEFAEYLAGRREWFHPGPRLMAHIDGLASRAA